MSSPTSIVLLRFAALALVWLESASGCTNIMVPAGSSVDGSTIITYSTDNGRRFGEVVHWPGGRHADGELREIYDFGSGRKLGAIPEAPVTFNVVGNTNEHQLSIGETTFGGLAQLDGAEESVDFPDRKSRTQAVCDKTYGCLDYGQMMYVTLQRARNAREAITVLDELMQTYGYASSGESLSIADPHEVWLMEVIGKGNISIGSVWVATRVPDGFVCAHANQARTRTFDWNDPENVRYTPDVASFARSIGVYSGTDEDFSFSDVYNPINFHGARFGESRVYALFSRMAEDGDKFKEKYLEYARGYDLANRMPLFVQVAHKLSVNDTMWLMKDHFEGTWFDPKKDVGAGLSNSPYRNQGLTWDFEGNTYVNERSVGVSQAAMNIVANQRPGQRFSVLWFGVDDATFSLHTPIYGATTRLPPSWDGHNCTGRATCREAAGLPGTITKFSLDAMHWVGQLVANFAYSRYDHVAPAVFEKLAELEADQFEQVRIMDAKLLGMENNDQAVEAATDFSYRTAETLHSTWRTFWGELFVTYVDGYVTVLNPNNRLGGCDKESPGLSEAWKRRIVEETGDHYLAKADAPKFSSPKPEMPEETGLPPQQGRVAGDHEGDFIIFS